MSAVFDQGNVAALQSPRAARPTASPPARSDTPATARVERPAVTAGLSRYPVTQPVLFKRNLSIAPLLLLLQAAAPPVIAAAVLYGLAALCGVEFDGHFIALAIVASALSLVLLRPPGNAVSQLLSGRLAMAVDVLVRWGVLFVILLIIGWLTKTTAIYSRRVIIGWALLTPGLLMLVTLALYDLARRVLLVPENMRRVVFVGYNANSACLSDTLNRHAELCMSVIGFFDDRSRDRLGIPERLQLLGRFAELAAYVKRHGIDVIFVALPGHIRRVQELLDALGDTTASIYYVPDIGVFDLIQGRTADILGIPVVALCETPFYGYRGLIKRSLDLAIAAALLLVAAPLMAAIALAIKASSTGPTIFKQRRYGLDGEEIVIFKFRTMTVMEDGTVVRQATRNDLRTTALGRILRRYSLDELPQLINVLQGRMSLVGPRPHAVAHNEEYRKLIKSYMVRHKVLPGLTGLAQVSGCRGETSRLEDMQRRVDLDLDYLRNWSPLLDLKILLLTVPKVLSARKAF